MSHKVKIACLEMLFLVGTLGAMASAQPQDTSKPIASDRGTGRRGFLDYALGKINPKDRDYGALMQAERETAVRHTIDDLYFWSNVLSLLLLTGAVAIIFLQWRAAEKRELIAASLIAQLWNGRVSDRIEIDRRTEQFNQLVATHNAEVERSLAAKPQPTTTSELRRTVETLDKRSTPVAPAVEGEAANVSVTASANDPRSDSPAVGLQQRNVMLERQVEAMKNTETNLRKRLNDTISQLEQERNRNQALKGV
jgi:hypothetical protein